jgi:hypothetical protein
MENEATLGQIKKILSYLENVSSEDVQSRLPQISAAIHGNIYRVRDIERVKGMWKMILAFTRGNDVRITVPHVPYKYAEDRFNQFQLRCWLGEHGYTGGTSGHVDSGSAKGDLLFEVYLPTDLCNYSEGWAHALMDVGIDVMGVSVSAGRNGSWVLESRDKYDIVSFRPH